MKSSLSSFFAFLGKSSSNAIKAPTRLAGCSPGHKPARRAAGVGVIALVALLIGAVTTRAENPIAAFADWAASYTNAATPQAKQALIARGETLALERARVLREWFRTDTDQALAAAVSPEVRAALPKEIVRHLEKPVSGRGFFGVLIEDEFETGRHAIRREVVIGDRRYEAFVARPHAQTATQEDVFLSGVALDDSMAVREISAGSGARLAGAKNTWSQGPKSLLFIRVAFPESPAEPMTQAEAHSLMDTVNQWYIENSYDTTAIIATVTPLFILPQTEAWYKANREYTLRSDALEVAKAAGYDSSAFDLDAVRYNNGPGSFSGLAYVGGRGCWLKSSSSGVAIHEFGHNYGLWHGNYWNATGDSVIGPGSNTEYGDSFDTMGSASGGSLQFNAAFKNQIDWLPNAFVQTVGESGTYRLRAYDVPDIVPGQFYALKIRKNYDRNYWAEFRQKFTSNRWLQNGVLLHWDPWNNGMVGSASGTHLLDTTPGTTPGKDDGAVVIGRTFSDRPAGVHITPVARGSNSQGNWIDVAVNLGGHLSNQAPSLALLVDATNVFTNTFANFTALASDPDGDALAFCWDFGDGALGPNLPHASKRWGTNGHYVLTCTASDMKGGLTTRQQLITVGTPATHLIRGRVATAEGQPLEGVRVHNGQSSGAYRGTYTDSHGEFILVNIAPGTNTISAVKYGYTFTRSGGWTNPVATGPDAGGIDFTATPVSFVNIVATDASAAEAGPEPAMFTITRTGPTTNALTVRYNYSGTASYTSDYSLSPAPTNTAPYGITIPVGASSVSLLLLPVNDTAAEPPESVTLTLAETNLYALAYPAEATVTILDNEAAAKPSVTVSATSSDADNLATESGDDTGAFIFTRSANLTGPLTVRYSLTGTASNGVDFTWLDGNAVIPEGQSSVSIAFITSDDVEVEGSESVTATILSDPAYTSSGSSATITIADDDPTVVTVTTTDNQASEAGGNTANFLVTRTGSLAANLVVNYFLSGPATNGVDFNALSGAVTIPAGRATATITVTPINDALVEGDETVVLTLASTPACNVGNPGTATVVIQDNELPSVTLTETDATASEPGTDTGLFTFSRTGATNEPLTVYFVVTGTAVNGADYEAIGTSIEIPAGASNAPLVITPLDDAVREADQKVTLQLLPGAGYNPGTTALRSVTIKDDDTGLPGVGFTWSAAQGLESDTYVQLSVTLSTNSSQTVSVDYSVTGGSAAGAGVDYTLANGTVVFVPNVTATNLNFYLNNDAIAEPDETIVISLGNTTNALLDVPSALTYTILDDDGSGAVTISAVDTNASEAGPDNGLFRISRSGGTNADLAVLVQVLGTASAPSDYVPWPTTVVIPAGTNSVELLVEPVDDATAEAGETILVRLLSAAGGRIGSPSSATVFISDNDDTSALPIVSISAPDAAAFEPGMDTARFDITRDRGTNLPLMVAFSVGGTATSGTDFTAIGTSNTIPIGEWSISITVTARDDSTYEADETVIATLTQQSAYRVAPAAASATVTLVDNEQGVSVSAAGQTEEDGSSLGQFVFTRTGNSGSNLVVNFTVGGTAGDEDFVLLATTVTIPAGTNAAVLEVTPQQDAWVEGEETVAIRLLPGAGYTPAFPTNATVLILDDEPFLGVTASIPTAQEGGASGEFTITRSGATNLDLPVAFTLTGTASNGLDYSSISNLVWIPAGETNTRIALVPMNDGDMEGTESVVLTLLPGASHGLATASNATVFIVDDDLAPPTNTVTLQWLFSTASELGPSNAMFLLLRAGDASAALPVNLAFSGAASNGADYSLLSNVMVLPAGAASLLVFIQPVADDLAEGDESMTVTLQPGASYSVGNSNSLSLLIRDLPWDLWRMTNFTAAELADPGISGPWADPELDGLPNFYEYAFNLNAKAPSDPRVLDIAWSSGTGGVGNGSSGGASPMVTFHQRKAPTDVIYELESTTNFISWGSAPGWFDRALDDGNGITETARFRIMQEPGGPSGQVFLRLKVSR